MSISFACPRCGKSLPAEEDRVSEAGVCAECREILSVPTPKNRFAGAAASDRFRFKAGMWGQIFAGGMILFVIAMLLPRGGGRGPSRRLLCQSNLRQIVLSVLMHENAQGRLPLASSQPFTGQPGNNQSPHPAGYSWLVAIMPEMELDNHYNQWKIDSQDFQIGPFDPVMNQDIPADYLSMFNCPASSAQQVDLNRSEYKLLNAPSGHWAPVRSSYMAFAASHFTNATGPGQLYESESDGGGGVGERRPGAGGRLA